MLDLSFSKSVNFPHQHLTSAQIIIMGLLTKRSGHSAPMAHKSLDPDFQKTLNKDIYDKSSTFSDDSTIAPADTSLNVYYHKGSLWKNEMIFYAGESAERPIFMLKSREKLTGRRSLTIHHSNDEGSPPLGVAKSSPMQSLSCSLSLSDNGQKETKMKCSTHLKSESYTFTYNGEEFEWRQSRGNEVRGISGKSAGWKLARKSSVGWQRGNGGKRDQRAFGETSDGHEVVAVWGASCGLSKHLGVFELIGSAANNGLGEDFRTIALLSAVRIWVGRFYLTNAAVASNAAAASSAAAAVAIS